MRRINRAASGVLDLNVTSQPSQLAEIARRVRRRGGRLVLSPNYVVELTRNRQEWRSTILDHARFLYPVRDLIVAGRPWDEVIGNELYSAKPSRRLASASGTAGLQRLLESKTEADVAAFFGPDAESLMAEMHQDQLNPESAKERVFFGVDFVGQLLKVQDTEEMRTGGDDWCCQFAAKWAVQILCLRSELCQLDQVGFRRFVRESTWFRVLLTTAIMDAKHKASGLPKEARADKLLNTEMDQQHIVLASLLGHLYTNDQPMMRRYALVEPAVRLALGLVDRDWTMLHGILQQRRNKPRLIDELRDAQDS